MNRAAAPGWLPGSELRRVERQRRIANKSDPGGVYEKPGASRIHSLFTIHYSLFRLFPALFGVYAFLQAAPHEVILEHARAGRLDSAYALSQSQKKQDPTNPFYPFILAKLTLDGKESQKELLNCIKQSEEGSPEKEEALYQIAQYYYALGQYETAVRYFHQTEAISKNGWLGPSLYWMGQAYLNNIHKKPLYLDSAKQVFKRLTKAVPQDDYYFSLGFEGLARVGLESKDHEMAKDNLNKALETAASDQKPLLRYYQYLMAKQKGDSASMNAYSSLLAKKYPQSIEYINLRGQLGGDLGTVSHPFTLQLGAFGSKENADGLVDRLLKKNIQTHITPVDRRGKTLYVVRTEFFPSREAANIFGKKQLKPLGVAYYVIEKN